MNGDSKLETGDFPGGLFANWEAPNNTSGPVVKNSPVNSGNTGSVPIWGTNILQATGQLSPKTL